MSVFRPVGLVAWAWKTAVQQMGNPRLWGPFLLVAVVQTLLLAGLVNFHQPWAQAWALPYLQWVGGDAAIHYPYSFQVIPVAFARAEIFLGVFLLSFTVGVAVMQFASAMGSEKVGGAWRAAGAKYLSLAAYSAIAAALVVGVLFLQRAIPRELVLEDRMVRWGSRLAILGVAVILETLLIYGPVWIVLRGKNVFSAIPAAVGFSFRNFLPTLFLVAIPVLVKYPLGWLSGRGDLFIRKFQPEMLIMVMGTEILLELVLGFILVGSITAYFLWRTEDES